VDIDFDEHDGADERAPDPRQEEAEYELERYFSSNRESVFFSRQVEVQHEDRWYHWVSNRAIRELVRGGIIRNEVRQLATGGAVKLLWYRTHRYFRRDANHVVELIEKYADPNIGGAVGLHGELMVLEGFARRQFVMKGRATREFESKVWTTTNHDLDFIFERDGVVYGIEVKNTLGYMEHEELLAKVRMCAYLGIKPVFVARMLPKSWINEVRKEGGFSLILKYQLYPLAHKDLARRVSAELGLPVDSPKALADGTMDRFVQWHEKNL
jgi:hypothetical protein